MGEEYGEGEKNGREISLWEKGMTNQNNGGLYIWRFKAKSKACQRCNIANIILCEIFFLWVLFTRSHKVNESWEILWGFLWQAGMCCRSFGAKTAGFSLLVEWDGKEELVPVGWRQTDEHDEPRSSEVVGLDPGSGSSCVEFAWVFAGCFSFLLNLPNALASFTKEAKLSFRVKMLLSGFALDSSN